ncbi:IS5 family transposase [Klebsiella variicola]|uniref:IS5 family transposase n=1 Tax=Klebsiella variicola TaxID=244366 RepID=UPI000B9424BC
MKDQITHLPDNADRSVAKQKFKITNWPTYNKALINRGSITFWLDDEAIQAWYESATPSSRGRPQRYSDLAITTVLVIKRVFRLTLRAAQGFIDSIFSLMNVPLRCPDYSCVSRRAKSVNVSFKTPTRGEIAHLVIDSTGLKVFGEGEWKVKKHGQERRRIWRKLHLAVDSKTHEIICADLSLYNVTDSEAFPGLIRQTHRKIRAASADGAYDTRLCHDELRRKKISALIPPRKGAGYWPGEYADRNRAVANQRLTGSNARWKWTTDYNRRSIAETAMYRVKQLFGGSIDSTGLKVFGEGEWKVKKHGQERRRIWRKLHLAVDSKTHEIICADLSLNNVTDSEAFPGLIRQTHRKIRAASADGAYDTRLCHDELRRKKISALIPPRKGAGYWPGEYADRNRAVANQRMTGSNARWKWTTDYNRRSIAETAMYRVKQLFGGSLTLRDYDGQVAEAMALVRALNKMTKAGMPESVRIA